MAYEVDDGSDTLLALNHEQRELYQEIMEVCKESFAVSLSYDELFAVLDRVKFAYFLSFANDNGIIKFIKKNKIQNSEEKSR